MTVEIARIGSSALPAPSDLEQIEIDANRVRQLVYRRYADESQSGLSRLLIDVDQAMHGRAALVSRLASLQRPATKKELADRLSVLRISFPNAKEAGEAFSRVLIERLAARQPTFGAIDWAVRHLIDKCKFMPSIAETLEALAAAQTDLDAVHGYVQRLPKLRAEIAEIVGGHGG